MVRGSFASVVVTAARHDVPIAKSWKLSAAFTVVGVIIVRSAKNMTQFVADNANSGQVGRGAAAFGRARIDINHSVVVYWCVIDVRFVRPDAVRAAAALFSHTCKDNVKAVDVSVAVIVIFGEIHMSGGRVHCLAGKYLIAIVCVAVECHIACACIGPYYIHGEREQTAADVIVVVVYTSGAAIGAVIHLVEESLDIHFVVDKLFVVEREQNNKELFFSKNVAHRLRTLLRIVYLLPYAEQLRYLPLAEAQMLGRLAQKLYDLGAAHLFLGGYHVGRHHVAVLVFCRVHQTSVVAMKQAVSVFGLGPVHLLVSLKVYRNSDVPVAGLPENHQVRIGGYCHGAQCQGKKQKRTD